MASVGATLSVVVRHVLIDSETMQHVIGSFDLPLLIRFAPPWRRSTHCVLDRPRSSCNDAETSSVFPFRPPVSAVGKRQRERVLAAWTRRELDVQIVLLVVVPI
jgi:hypothetical protein